MAEESLAEPMGVMFGSGMKDSKQRKVTFRIGKDVHVIAEIPCFSGRIPSNIAIGLREKVITGAIMDSTFPAITSAMGTETCSSYNGSTVSRQTKRFWVDHT